jgi:hypothetical protein
MEMNDNRDIKRKEKIMYKVKENMMLNKRKKIKGRDTE